VSQKLKHILPKQLGKSNQFLQLKKIDCEKLRTYDGFENVNDNEAKFILEELERLAIILYKQIITE